MSIFRLHLMPVFLFCIEILAASSLLCAQTVLINTTETATQDLDALSPGASPKTAMVGSSGSVSIPAGNPSPAIWGSTDGWDVTVFSGRKVEGGNFGVLFNSSKDSFGAQLKGKVTIQDGALVSAGTDGEFIYGIYAGDNSTIDNFGTISANGPESYAAGASIDNSGTLINRKGAVISVNGRDSQGLFSWDNSTFINEKGAAISVQGIDAAVGIMTNSGSTIVNSGSISVNAPGAFGIWGAHANVTNNGSISTFGSRDSNSGVRITESSILVNNGSIHAQSSAEGEAVGVQLLQNSSMFNKTGSTIQASGTQNSTGIWANAGSTILNETGASITSAGRGVDLSQSSTLINHGGISGLTGVYGWGDITVENYGTITGTGGKAIDLQGYDNRIIVHNGAIIEGSIDGGSGLGMGSTIEFIGSGSYVHNIRGDLALIKSGIGVWNLTGTNTHTGGTTIHAGAIAVNGSMAGPVLVGPNGTIAGTGIIQGTVYNQGIIAPGNTLGALTIQGDYVHGASSVYQADTSPSGQADSITVSGTARIEGGRVSVQAENGTYTQKNTYPIIQADSVQGAFKEATSNLAFLNPSLHYSNSTVYLTLTRNDRRFADVAATNNQRSVAAVFDASDKIGDMAAVLAGLESLTEDGARNAFNQSAGLLHANMAEASVQIFNGHLNVIADRMRQNAPHLPADTAANQDRNRNFWVKGYGSAGEKSGKDVSSCYDLTSAGIAAGYDHRLSRGRIGLATGLANARASSNGLKDAGDLSLYHASLYGSYRPSDWYLNGILSYGHSSYGTSRHIAWGPVNRTARANYGGNSIGWMMETGRRMEVGPAFAVIPALSIQHLHSAQEKFTEKGADSLNLQTKQDPVNSLIASFGARALKTFSPSMQAEARFHWNHAFLNSQYRMNANLAGVPFTVQGTETYGNAVVVGMGIIRQIKNNLNLSAAYDATLSKHWDNHSASMGLHYSW